MPSLRSGANVGDRVNAPNCCMAIEPIITALGRKLGIPQSQISRIERNPDHTTIRTLRRIAKALQVDIRALI